MSLLPGRRQALFVLFALSSAACGSGGGSAGGEGPTPNAAAAPTVQISASPAQVASGESSWISWSTTNATACEASGAWLGAQPVSGSYRTGPLTAATTFNLSCNGAGGGAVGRVTVAIGAPGQTDTAPSVALKAVQGSVPLNGAAELTWAAPDAKSCVASGGWSGSRANKGSQRIAGLRADTTFNLVCQGEGGTGVAMTEVVLQRATLRWGAPSVAPKGYRIFWGKRSGQPEHSILISNPSVRERIIELPGPGTYYFVMAVLNAQGGESGRSNQVSKIIPA